MINKNYLFASHYPLLTEMLLKTDGDIIEFGTGLWSTVLLHIFASPERKVYSVENDDFWLDKVLYLKNDYHLLGIILCPTRNHHFQLNILFFQVMQIYVIKPYSTIQFQTQLYHHLFSITFL